MYKDDDKMRHNQAKGSIRIEFSQRCNCVVVTQLLRHIFDIV